MNRDRLTALTDAVLAVIITIMVLEMKAPHGARLEDLVELWPVFLSYLLSFIYVAIYWNNHHHFFQLVKTVDGTILWANMHLLFWISTIPFTTAWMGENHFAPLPSALYGLVLFAAGVAYLLLQQAIIGSQGEESALKQAIGKDWKGKVSAVLYFCAIVSTFFALWLAQVIYVAVAVLWLVPDRRIERSLQPDT